MNRTMFGMIQFSLIQNLPHILSTYFFFQNDLNFHSIRWSNFNVRYNSEQLKHGWDLALTYLLSSFLFYWIMHSDQLAANYLKYLFTRNTGKLLELVLWTWRSRCAQSLKNGYWTGSKTTKLTIGSYLQRIRSDY